MCSDVLLTSYVFDNIRLFEKISRKHRKNNVLCVYNKPVRLNLPRYFLLEVIQMCVSLHTHLSYFILLPDVNKRIHDRNATHTPHTNGFLL